MKILYPIRSIPEAVSAGKSGEGDPVTVLVHRLVPLAEEKEFLTTLNRLLGDFNRFPGTAGSMVFRRPVGGDIELSIIQRFVGEAEHDAWLGSPQFERWRSKVAPTTPMHGHVRRYSGMESFFVSAQAPDAPPRWKMAVLLMIVVYPMSLALSTWGAPALARLPLFAGTFFTSVFMVLLMTYVLVPILTKLFQRWLQPVGSKG